MYFGLFFIMLMVGGLMMGFCGLMPPELQPIIPPFFRFALFILGFMLPIMGFMMLVGRARKTGADKLIKPSIPGTVLWFFFYRDGKIRITDAIRTGEGQLYNPLLDSQVFDVRSYTLADHKVRIVPEVVGHAADLDFVLYVNVLKGRFGFESLKDVRTSLLDKIKRQIGVDTSGRVISEEQISRGERDV